MDVQICIPHYFQETEAEVGYGSCRKGNQLPRAIALSRCLSALINSRRSRVSYDLNIGARAIDQIPTPTIGGIDPEINIEITVCVTSDRYLHDVLAMQAGNVRIARLNPGNPRELGLAARDHLIRDLPKADLSIYMEDDLIISDPLYFDKLIWFHQRTRHRCCLMPHRYESRTAPNKGRLYVDGPLSDGFIRRFAEPRQGVARSQFRGTAVSFDVATNPHSGTFCLSAPQVELLRQKELPRSGFIGPLETAATLTVLTHFPVLKTANSSREFLTIEHGHKSFLGYFNSLPIRSSEATPPRSSDQPRNPDGAASSD